MAGDFNALWTAPELAALRRVATAASAPSLAGQTSLIGTTGALIDHIALISPALPAASSTGSPAPMAILQLAKIALVLDQPDVSGVMPSDHAGVMALLTSVHEK